MTLPSARKGTLRVLGKGDKIREIPIHPRLRTDLHLWLHERPDWPEGTRNPALLLNNRGGRLTTRGASGIFRQIADNAGLDDQTTATSFDTTLIRGGTDLSSSLTCSATPDSTPSASTPTLGNCIRRA